MERVVQHSVLLPATPGRVYETYLDPRAHAVFTGGAATIAAAPNGEFLEFDGRIAGRILHLVPDRRIVQTWRSFEWAPDELDSILVLRFEPEGSGTRLSLVQVNVPDRLFPTLQANWPMRYFDPWCAYLTVH